MIEYKQPAIVNELRRRIRDGVYVSQLPTTAELAAEFNVNIKTMSKAVNQLVEAKWLERRRRCGTRVISGERIQPGRDLIEVIFEGFTTIFTHPFWREIWAGMVSKLSAAGYRPVLNMLEADRETGLLRLDHFSMCPSAGKIVLGIVERRLLEQVAASGVPFVTSCDPIGDPEIPQVTFDFTQGICQAVDFFQKRGLARIAFIGQTTSFVNLQQLHKYNAYLKAVQTYRQIEPALVEDVRPLAGLGAAALSRLLARTVPDALIAAYDHQLPEMEKLMRERNLAIPVIGCDGLALDTLDSDRHVVKVPLRECGEAAARQLLEAIRERRAPRSLVLPAVFR